jgi:hypothetical protein
MRITLKDLLIGDVVLILFPHTDGMTCKRRPVVVIYNDKKSRQITVAKITGKIREADISKIFIVADSKEYASMGLQTASMIDLSVVQTVNYELVKAYIGCCPDSLIQEIKDRRRKMDDERELTS